MSLDIGHHQVDPLGQALVGSLQHGVGLAHASSIAEKDLESPARLLPLVCLDARQQLVWIGAL